jgi:PAS domain S-box-containing protein
MRLKTIGAAAEDLGSKGFVNRFSIGRRLTLCFVGIFVLLLAVNGILLWQFHSAQVIADRRLTGVSVELIAVLNLQSSLQSFNDRLDKVAQSQNAVILRQESGPLRDMILESVQDARNAISHLPHEVRPYPTLIPTIEAIESTLPLQLESLNSLAASGDWSALRLRLANEKQPLDEQTSMLVKSITRELNDELGQTVTNIARLQRQMVIVLPLTALGTLLIASLLGLIITRSITTPLGKLMEGSSALSRGEFDHVVPITGDDELARLGRVFNDTAGKLRSVYETLQDSNAKLEEAQRITHVGYWEWDLATNRVKWSDETYRIYGMQPQECPMDLATLREKIPPEDWERAMAVASGGSPRFSIEYRVLRPTGEVRIVHTRGEVKKDASGRPYQMFGTVQDITDSKRAEDALRKSEKELRDLIDTIPALVWSALPDGSNSYANKRFVEYLGLSAEHTAGSRWHALIHPDDLERHANKWMEAVASGKPHENESRYRRSDGEYRWHLDRGMPLRDEDGNILKWYGVVTDIEDLKRAQEALGALSRDLQESKAKLEEAQRISHVGYWEWDPLTDRVNWSDETYRIYGMQPQERAMYLATVAEKIHPEDWKRATEAAATGVPFNVECRLFRPTGEMRIADFQGDVKRDSSGQPSLRFGTIQDITDRKRAEQRLRESEAYLAEAQRLSQTGSWAWKPATGDIRYWSEMCFRLLGFDPTGPLPRFEEFFHRIHPDDQTVVRERFDRATREKADFELDYRVEHPEKGTRDIHVVGHAVLDASGNLDEFVGTVIDVTERKRAEEALQKSRLYLSEGQRLAHMGSWAFNPSGFFEYWSEELFRIYGLDPQKGAPTLEEYLATIHPQDRDLMANTIRRMHAERSGCDVKKRIVRPDGELRYIRCVGIPAVEGEVLKGFLGTAIDITEQELLTKEAERRQAYLAEAQRLTHTGSWAWNVNTDELFWSEEIFRIYEVDPVKAKPGWAIILDSVHPEDRASLLQRKEMESTQMEWSESEFDFRIVLADGRIKHLHSIAHPVDASGKVVEVIGTVMDVTERKRVEDSLRRSESYLAEAQKLTHTGSGAWRVAGDEALYLSEEWFRIYGFDPKQGLSAWKARAQRVHPEDRAKVRAAKDRAIREKLDYEVEYRIVLPDGTLKYNHTLGHPVLNASGDVEQFVCTWMDITERKLAEQELEKLRQLEADLAHVNRVSMLGEMAASLAHEIKQPIAAAITSANSCIEWLSHEPPNLDRARAAATRIDKYGNRAAEIIDRIRSFYRKSPSKRELVNVNGIVQEMLTLLNGEATRHSVSMHTELASELPTIMADRVQLQQVFMNLMLNAIEAMKDAGGELTVKSETRDGQLQLSVSDTGVGLPTEKMDQIFSAFFTTKPQGSGMGLAISRSIVESHGGRLWATANNGAGATFHFTLPIQVTDPSPLVA